VGELGGGFTVLPPERRNATFENASHLRRHGRRGCTRPGDFGKRLDAASSAPKKEKKAVASLSHVIKKNAQQPSRFRRQTELCSFLGSRCNGGTVVGSSFKVAGIFLSRFFRRGEQRDGAVR